MSARDATSPKRVVEAIQQRQNASDKVTPKVTNNKPQSQQKGLPFVSPMRRTDAVSPRLNLT